MGVTGGLTLVDGKINLAKVGRLFFTGTQTLGGTGTVTFADGQQNNGLDVAAGSTLTIAPGITIHGNTRLHRQQHASAGTGSFVNQGTISADMGGRSIARRQRLERIPGPSRAHSGFIFLAGHAGQSRQHAGPERHHRLVLPRPAARSWAAPCPRPAMPR